MTDFSQPPKQVGAHYTPDNLAQVLAEWVVQTGKERLLEPSAGDGALIRAAVARGKSCSMNSTGLTFVSCDTDKTATSRLNNLLTHKDIVINGDFLSTPVAPELYVDGVLANPPFTRNHAINSDYRKQLRNRFSIEGAAGLWVHFLIHACTFLKVGGRLAFLIPASALFTRYGQKTLERICRDFSHVEVRQIMEQPQWIGSADERGAILLARGYKHGCCNGARISTWPQVFDCDWIDRNETGTVFRELMSAASTLGQITTFSIGVVTGCNDVFLLSENERQHECISKDDVIPIVARSRHVSGLIVTTSELEKLAARDEPTWLLAPEDISERATGIRRRLARISRDKRRSTTWFYKRTPWWQVGRGPTCDAVFTYMNHLGPRLVLAGPGIRCTNTLHRVNFNDDVPMEDRCAATLCQLSTFGQLAAEKLGRIYGGGVLKFELINARQLPFLFGSEANLCQTIRTIDDLLREKKLDTAREKVDELLLQPYLGAQWEVGVNEMRAHLDRYRFIRHGRRVA